MTRNITDSVSLRINPRDKKAPANVGCHPKKEEGPPEGESSLC